MEIKQVVYDYETEHGVSWRMVSFDYVGQDDFNRHEFIAHYRVRDSY